MWGRANQADAGVDRVELVNRPAGRTNLAIIVINRVGVEKPVAGRNMVAPPSCSQPIEGPPQPQGIDGLFQASRHRPALSEIVGVGDEDGFPRHTQHLGDSLFGFRYVVKNGEFADQVEFSVCRGQGIDISVFQFIGRESCLMPDFSKGFHWLNAHKTYSRMS